jgi:hypothetical protein
LTPTPFSTVPLFPGQDLDRNKQHLIDVDVLLARR